MMAAKEFKGLRVTYLGPFQDLGLIQNPSKAPTRAGGSSSRVFTLDLWFKGSGVQGSRFKAKV